MNVLNLLKD